MLSRRCVRQLPLFSAIKTPDVDLHGSLYALFLDVTSRSAETSEVILSIQGQKH